MFYRKTEEYKIDPVCVFNIVSQYMKKPIETDKVFGLIWGRKYTHITSTCSVAYNEDAIKTKAIVIDDTYRQVYRSADKQKYYHFNIKKNEKVEAPAHKIVTVPKEFIGKKHDKNYKLTKNEDDDEIILDKESLENQKKIHEHNNTNEQVIGWYITGEKITDPDIMNLHSIFNYILKIDNPYLLLVNTNLSASSPSTPLGLQLFKETNVQLGVDHVGSYLQRVPISYNTNEEQMNVIHSFSDPENNEDTENPVLGRDILNQYDVQLPLRDDFEHSASDDLEYFHQELQEFKNNLDTLRDFVNPRSKQNSSDGFVNTIEDDPKVRIIGQLIKDAMLQLPVFPRKSFEPLFQGSLQDLLMIQYLAKLARTHTEMTDRLILSVK